MAFAIAPHRQLPLHLDDVGKTYQMGEVSDEVLSRIDLQIFHLVIARTMRSVVPHLRGDALGAVHHRIGTPANLLFHR